MKLSKIFNARLALFLLALSLTPAPARAQIGNLIKKKAAEQVTKAVHNATGKDTAQATGRAGRRRPPMQPEAVTIDSPTLDSLLRGLAAMTSKLRLADSLHREVARSGGVDSAGLREASGYAMELEEKRPCFDAYFERMDFDRLQEASRIAHAPSASVESMRAFEEAQIAMDRKRNDMSQPLPTDERRRLVRDFLLQHASMRVDPRADTARAVQQCGPAPRLSDAGRRTARNDTLLMRARVLESEAGAAGTQASGLADHRFFVLRERLYIWMKQRDAVQWGEAERGVLARRNAELERVRRGILGAEAAGT